MPGMATIPESELELELNDFEDKPLPTYILDEISREDPLSSSAPLDLSQQQQQHRRSSAPGVKSPRATAYLDGLRGLAAFLVYISHQIPWYYGTDNDLMLGFGANGRRLIGQLPFVRILFTGGNASVTIFFVLSGYVLSISPLRMLRARGEGNNVRKCYDGLLSAVVRRPFRLFVPPIGVSLAFAFAMHLPFGLAPSLVWPVPEPNIFAEMRRWVGETAYMMNPFVAHGIQEHWFVYDPPAWTMAVEFEGSMIVFGLLALSGRLSTGKRTMLFAMVGLVLLFAYSWAMSCFMAGVLLAINDLEGYDHAMMPRQVSALGKKVFHHFVFFLGWYLLSQPAGTRDPTISLNTPGWWLLTKMIPSNYMVKEYWRFWHNWGAMMLVYGVLRIPWLQRFFNTKTLRYLGKISFSLYLTHIPLLWTLCDRIYRLFGLKRQPEFTTWFDDRLVVPDVGMYGLSSRFLVSMLLILPLSLVFAEIGTLTLDEPSITIGRWIVAKLMIGEKR